MLSKLSSRVSKKFCKIATQKISHKSQPKPINSSPSLPHSPLHSHLLLVGSSHKDSKTHLSKTLLALGFALAAQAEGGKKDDTLAPPPVTSDPTKKDTPPEKKAHPQKTGKKKTSTGLPYPGPCEHIDHDSKDVLEFQGWTGAQVRALTGAHTGSRKLEASFDILAGPQVQRTFHSSNLVLHGQLGNDFTLTGKLSGNGRAEGHLSFLNLGVEGLSITPHWKINPQNPQYNSVSVDVAQKGDDYHMTGSVDSKTYNLTYMQSFWKEVNKEIRKEGPKFWTKDIGAGVQMLAPRPITQAAPVFIPAIRFRILENKDKIGDIWTGQWVSSQHGMFLTYTRKEGVQLSLSTSLILMWQTRESAWAVGAKFDTQKFLYQAKISSDGIVSVVVDCVVTPMVKLSFSGELYHFQNQPPGFGIGVTVAI